MNEEDSQIMMMGVTQGGPLSEHEELLGGDIQDMGVFLANQNSVAIYD